MAVKYMKNSQDKKYHVFSYREVAEMFDNYFTQSHFQTNSSNKFRIRYEVTMSEIDFWINIQNYNISTCFDIEDKKFKSGLFYHLKKMGWKPTDIKGRWKKVVLL